MFINFWYPAELSANIESDPVKCKILGQNLVLFRDSQGEAQCLSNICVHRCASLSNGWTSGDHVVCPYHGWEYNGDGKCRHIPSLGRAQEVSMARARVDAYPTQERYGIVFVFLGDLPAADRPPLMEVGLWDKPGWRSTTASYEWKANYRRVVENALDFSHPEFVHLVGRRGADPNYHVPDYDIEEHAWGAGADVTFTSPKGMWRFADEGTKTTTVAGTTFYGPAQFVTHIHIGSKMKNYQYVFESPIDEYNVRTFLVSSRNFFTHRLFDGMANSRNMKIAEEDRIIAENLEPLIGRDGRTDDLSVKADKIQIVYREQLKAWEAKGWRIDCEALRAGYPGKEVHVIPSPQRRESGNWVFNTVPLIPSANESPAEEQKMQHG
jgi:phenylpropionate dioxygenase-like ring-hydroxylating dioxygenase large terminal subunit